MQRFPIKENLGAIFIHVPKTGGNSIHTVLAHCRLTASAANHRRSAIRWLHNNWQIVAPAIRSKHVKASDVRATIGREVWDCTYTFCFVRNPWALMVSSYFWWQQLAARFPYLAERAAAVRRMDNFSEFLHSELGALCINELPAQSLSDWFVDDTGRDIVKFVGRLERIDRDLRELLSDMGAVYEGAIPHVNASSHTSYRDYYTAQTRALVGRRFADVIDRFKYQF